MGFEFGTDGNLRPFTAEEVAAMKLRTAGVRDGSHPSMTLGERENSIRREWLCKWGQQDNAVCALLGGAAYVAGSGSSGGSLSRVMPMYYPGKPKFIAVEIESIRGNGSCGIDNDQRVPAYKDARIAVRHELVFYKLGVDDPDIPEYSRYTETLPSTTETSYLTMPGSMLLYRMKPPTFDPHGVPIPFNVGRVENVTKIGRKWHRVPRSAWEGSDLYKRVKGDPVTGARGYIGTVNKTTLFGNAPGTMLLLGVDEDIVGDPTVSIPGGMGDYAYNLTYWWHHKTTGRANEGFGHNYLYYGGTFSGGQTAGYYLATKASEWIANGSIPDGACLFDEREHADLFNVGT